MLRGFGICPEGAEQKSPGQRPGIRGPDMPKALKGRHKGSALSRPFRAWSCVVGTIPGRCPGLICGCPFGAAGRKCATSKTRERGDRSRRAGTLPRSRVGLVLGQSRPSCMQSASNPICPAILQVSELLTCPLTSFNAHAPTGSVPRGDSLSGIGSSIRGGEASCFGPR
jgi:hypothetical protein